MKILVVLILTASLLVHSSNGSSYLGKTPEGLEIHKIDLSEEPRLRFKEITKRFKNESLAVIEIYKDVISEAINFMFTILEMVTLSSSSEMYQELDGIAEELGLPTNDILMMNYLYELDAYCTSIVARMPNGTLFMARNLDFYFPNETRKTLYLAKFYRGDNFIFEAPMFSGIIGVYTGFKPKSFAMAINERTRKVSGFDFLKNLAMLFTGN